MMPRQNLSPFALPAFTAATSIACLLFLPCTAASESGPEGGVPLAAPGYVDDKLCGQCHRDVYESFKTVGMSRAFYRPSRENIIEDYENSHFYHEASLRHYEMYETDGRFFLKRYRLGPSGEELDVLDREIHWILGSGNNARSYIHQTAWGELFQLPISWYTKSGKWAMAPGYDKADHQGFSRRVQRDCMFCHNSYPEVPVGSDTYDAPQTFPEELPRGLGCQRCHGPGDAHVRVSFDLDASVDDARAAIFNPVHLEPARQDEVCLQCHLQPTVALSGIRRFERSMYSYRPDQPLDDYLVYMDVVEERPKEERFEINHHPYRLHQSRCFQESQGTLSCLTCHDPHHTPKGEAARVQYRDACLSCHQMDQCRLEEMTQNAAAETTIPQGVAPDDCAACHMPRRRTQDVVQATMTDHLIQRRPGGPELTAPIPEQQHRIATVEFLRPERAPKGPLAEVYRQLVMVRSGSKSALPRLRSALDAAKPEHAAPYLELAVGELGAGKPADAEITLKQALELDPELVAARLLLGVALGSQGKLEPALEHLQQAYQKAPDRPEVRFNLGKALVHVGRVEEGISHLEAAVKARPFLESGWTELGNTHARTRQFEKAIQNYRESLAVDPSQETARRNLVLSLVYLKRRTEAMAELEAWLHFEPQNAWAQQRLQGLRVAAAAPGATR